jgi:diguanylate cyclase (GGDEF)-like protein/PAS domain S-box-containing protein
MSTARGHGPVTTLAGFAYARAGWDLGRDGHLWEALLAAQSGLGEGVAVVDLEHLRLLFVNDALCRMCGYRAEEILDLPNYYALVAPDDAAAIQAKAGGRSPDDLRDGAAPRHQTRMVRKDGQIIEVDVSVKPLPSLPGSCMIAVVRDVSQERRREREASAAERKYRELVERLPVVTYVAEPGEVGAWIYISPQIERIMGYTPQEWMADPLIWANAIHPDDRDRVLDAEERLKTGKRPSALEYRLITRGGSVLWVSDEAVLRAEAEDGVWLLDGLFVDISDRKAAETQLQHLADHDALTGLLNRRRFIEDLTLELKLAKREQRHSTVLVIDVDNFKYVNDSLGHHAGDQLIRSVAKVLGTGLREADTLSRLGGDEFALLLRGTAGDDAAPVARRLIQAVRGHSFAIATEPIAVTASAGLASIGGGDETAEEVLADADMAMYESKRSGRDRVMVFSPGMRTRLEERRTWADRIRGALQEDGRGLLLYQQPILDLATNEVSQYELLIRMEGPDGTVIAPEQFLPVAERFDLVQAIDRWVVGRAIALLSEHERAGRELVLTVNLSGRSMGDAALFELLEHDLSSTGIDASRLVLEITETAAIENMEEARVFAERLAALGCRLALDDFGSGFGSFYYLKHLPFHYLKIDGDFVRNLTRNPVDQAVVRSIVQIAASVGYETIAEFVADEATLQAVREYGVDYAQGFEIGIPEPVTAPAGPG